MDSIERWINEAYKVEKMLAEYPDGIERILRLAAYLRHFYVQRNLGPSSQLKDVNAQLGTRKSPTDS